MAMPFYCEHLQPEDWDAFAAEYAEYLELVEASFVEGASLARSGGQVPTECLGMRSDATRKARRVARLASRLVGREVR